MNNFLWAIGASIVVSLISFIGIISFLFKDKILDKVLFLLIGFSAGGLIGGAFLHLLPEALEKSQSTNVFSVLILGIVLFFVMEKYFYWRHCHEGVCDIHAFTYLNLIGDSFHNFIDGMVIVASFAISVKLGLVTTLAIIFHEIPQELGDFGVLVYGGFGKQKALFYNFISALAAVLGAVVGYFMSGLIEGFSGFILPLTAGGFIYIATSDLIPQMHKEDKLRRSTYAFIAFLLGIIFMAIARLFLKV